MKSLLGGFILILLFLVTGCNEKTVHTSGQKGELVPPPNGTGEEMQEYFDNDDKPRSDLPLFQAEAGYVGESVPDCVQYNALFGRSMGASDENRKFSCNFLSEWEVQDNPDNLPIPDVKTALQTCRGDGSNKRFLVMDLKSQIPFTSAGEVVPDYFDKPSKKFLNSGSVGLGLVYCLDFSENINRPDVYVLDPDLLSYEVLSSDQQNSYIEKLSGYPGWVRGTFVRFGDDGNIAPVSSSLRLTRYQRRDADEIDLLDNAGDELDEKYLPRMEFGVRPRAFSAKDPHPGMGIYLSDAQQSLRRADIDHAGVNPLTGELKYQTIDAAIPLFDTVDDFSIQRTYRSFHAQVGPFGYGWDLNQNMSMEYVQLSDVFDGRDGRSYPVLDTGEGRRLFVPDDYEDTAFGSFWGQDPFDSSKPSPLAPLSSSSTLFPVQSYAPYQFDLNGRFSYNWVKGSNNNVYRIYNGELEMMMDQTAVRQDTQTRIIVQDLFHSAANALGYGRDPGDKGAALDLIEEIGKYPGNYVFFHTDPSKGYIRAILSKQGFVWYRYRSEYDFQDNNGDLLEGVTRYGRHNPDEADAMLDYGFDLEAYQYDDRRTDRSDDINESWGGLLTDVQDLRTSRTKRHPIISNVNYRQDRSLFSEAPVVASLDYGPMSYDFNYAFKNKMETGQSCHPETEGTDCGVGATCENNQCYIPEPTTTVSNELGQEYVYVGSYIPYAKKIIGPTESSNEPSVLREELWSPKLLRPVDIINRGRETIFDYKLSFDDDWGYVVSVEETQTDCAERDLPARDSDGKILAEGQAFTPRLAHLNKQGEIEDLQCEVTDNYLIRQTKILSEPWRPYYLNWDESLIAIKSDLPTSDLINNQERKVETEGVGCLLGVGYTTINGVQESGTRCQLAEDYRGGSQVFIESKTEYQNGKVAGILTPQAPNLDYLPGDEHRIELGKGYFEDILSTDVEKLAFSQTDQTGFFVSVPAKGMDYYYQTTDFGGTGSLKHLSGKIYRFYDSMGNPIVELNDRGAVRKYIYDYRDVQPRLVSVREENPLELNDETEGLIADLLEGSVARDNGNGKSTYVQWDNLKNALTSLRSSDEFRVQYSTQRSFTNGNDGMKLSHEYTSSGDRVSYGYDSNKPWLLASVVTSSLKKCEDVQLGLCDLGSASTVMQGLWIAYDDYERPFQKTQVLTASGNPPKIIEETSYKDATNGAAYKWTTTQINTGGANEEKEILEWDYAGRPKTVVVHRFGDEEADSVYSYIYGPFGEVLQTKEDYDNQQLYTDLETDPQLDVLTRSISYAAGDRVDTSMETTEYSNFDLFLNSRRVTDKETGVSHMQSEDNVPGLYEQNQIFAPSEYKGSGQELVTSSRTATDGCGNMVLDEADIGNEVGEQKLSTRVEIDTARCSPLESTNSLGQRSVYHYSISGQNLVRDSFKTSGSRDTGGSDVLEDQKIEYGVSLLHCQRDSVGRCSSPGSIISLNIVGSPTTSDVQNDSGYLAEVQSASIIASNSLGTLSEAEFNPEFAIPLAKNHEFVTAIEKKESAWDLLSDSQNSIAKTLPYQITRSIEGTDSIVDSQMSLVGSGARSMIETRVNPIQGKQSIQKLTTYDSLGNPLVETLSQTFPSVENLSRAEIDESKGFEFGVPKEKTVSQLDGSNYQTRVQTEMLDGDHVKQLVLSSTHKDFNHELVSQYDFTDDSGHHIVGYDGMGRTVATKLYSESSGVEDLPSLTSYKTTGYDLGGQINFQNVTMQDAIDGNANYQINGSNIPRAVLGLTQNSQDVSYERSIDEYTGGEIITVHIPVGSHEFKIEYFYLTGEFAGQIKDLRVTVPRINEAGKTLTHRFSPLAQKASTNLDLAFPTGIDNDAGVVLNQSEGVEWPPKFPMEGISYSTKGRKYEKFIQGDSYDNEWIEETAYRTQSFGLGENNYFANISFGSNDPSRILSSKTDVAYDLQELQNESGENKYRSCDNTVFSDQSGFSTTKTRTQEDSDWEVRKNSLGKPAYLKHSYYAPNKKWTMRVAHQVGVSGEADLTEEVISFGLNGANPTPARVIQSRRFVFDTPKGGKANFREFILDSGNDNSYTPYAKEEFQKNWTGNWIYVPASLGANNMGNVFAYHLERSNGTACMQEGQGCEWAVYLFVYDAGGNLRYSNRCENNNTRCYGATGFDGSLQVDYQNLNPCPKAPKEMQFYGSYLNNILALYPPSTKWSDPRHCETSSIYYNESETPTYATGDDPRVQPYGFSRFGAMGGRKDILGNTYMNGEVYDAYNGRSLDGAEGVNGTNRCLRSPEALNSARSILNMKRAQSTEEFKSRLPRYSLSPEQLIKVEADMSKFLSGEAFHPCQLIDTTNAFGMLWRAMGSSSVASLRCYARFSSPETRWYYNNYKLEPEWIKTGQAIAFGVANVAFLAAGVGGVAEMGIAPLIAGLFSPAEIAQQVVSEAAFAGVDYVTGEVPDAGF